jgi:hypothetical protein
VAASSWSVKKLAKDYENTSCIICPHLPSKLLHEYPQKFGTAHGGGGGVHSGALFQKAETEREVSKSLKIGTAYKTRMRWQMSLQRLVFRLP